MIAGDGKIHIISTGDLLAEASPPKVTITDFRIFNKSAMEVKKYLFDSSVFSLASNRNVVTIDFAALTFYNPSQVQYAYKMEGVDEDWIFTGNNSVSYSLSNGKYTFRVKAMNAEGVWNNEGTYMKITIRAPFWKKAWFIALVIFIIAAILYSIYKYRINQLKKLLVMRNNISQNLHDDIGASLSNINILNELARRNATNPEKSKEYLTRSGEDIQRISESLSDIVWNINPRYDDLQNLFIRMKRYAADMMDGKNISYDMEFPEAADNISLSMEKRRDLYLIFKEAVNNLVKYSKATHANLKMEMGRKKISLSIKDNGIGFDSSKLQYGNGITNMQQRAAACNALLEINSRPGEGTEIKLELHTT
jgi:signal transduction histidine kinase